MKDRTAAKETTKMDIVGRVVNMLKINHSLETLKEALMLLTEIDEERRDKIVNKLLAGINYLIAIEYKRQGKLEDMRKKQKDAVYKMRRLLGSTLPENAESNTIRGKDGNFGGNKCSTCIR